jgi:CRISPR/Cas system-associated exonuclease Cas4 (RecB family)
LKTINSWSFSRLLDFEACKYRAKLKYLDRIPEPDRPLPPGKTEHANERGTRVHTAAELYVKGGVELVPELHTYKEKYDELKTIYASEPQRISLEGEWAFDAQWNITAWKSYSAWCRMKLDAFVAVDDVQGRVIDFKTGRKYGNEVKHAEQGQLYQLSAFLRYPKLERIDVEFWYTDHPVDLLSKVSYTREQGTKYIDKFQRRAEALTSATEFPPNPNAHSCRYCPYLNNACEYGVSSDVLKAAKSPFIQKSKKKKPTGMAALFEKKE